jgi:hypothetical protein
MRPLLKGNIVKHIRITTKPDALQVAIDEALAQLHGIEVNSNDYNDKMTTINELYKLKEKNTPKRVSPDTMAIVVGNLVGIGMIIGYERAHVVTSKAIGFVLKSKV